VFKHSIFCGQSGDHMEEREPHKLKVEYPTPTLESSNSTPAA